MSAYSDRVIADGASAYWPMNETSGTTAVDVVGGRNGVISGGVVLNQPGRLAGAPAMLYPANGLGKVLPSSFPASGVAFSVEVWVNPDAASIVRIRSLCNRPVVFNGDWQWYLPNGSPVSRFYYVTDAVYDYVVPLPGFVAGQWFHAVLTGGNGQLQLYINGVAQTPKAATISDNGGPTTGIGCSTETPAGDAWGWTGAMQDFAFYPRLLTPAEILAHYALGITPQSASHPANLFRLFDLLGEPMPVFNKHIPVVPAADNLTDFTFKKGQTSGPYPCDALYVGGAGDVAAVDLDNVAVVFSGVPAGLYLPGHFRRVNAAGTTATNLLAAYIN